MPSRSHRDMIPTKTFCTRPLGGKSACAPTDQISRSCLARLRAGRHHFSRRGGRRSPARCGERLVAARADEIHEPEAKKEAPRIDAARRQALLKRRVEQLRKAGKHDAAVSTARRFSRSPNSGMGASIRAWQRRSQPSANFMPACTASRKPNRPISAHWTFARSRWDPIIPIPSQASTTSPGCIRRRASTT